MTDVATARGTTEAEPAPVVPLELAAALSGIGDLPIPERPAVFARINDELSAELAALEDL